MDLDGEEFKRNELAAQKCAALKSSQKQPRQPFDFEKTDGNKIKI